MVIDQLIVNVNTEHEGFTIDKILSFIETRKVEYSNADNANSEYNREIEIAKEYM